jgi:hypothetical protein
VRIERWGIRPRTPLVPCHQVGVCSVGEVVGGPQAVEVAMKSGLRGVPSAYVVIARNWSGRCRRIKHEGSGSRRERTGAAGIARANLGPFSRER